MNPIDLPICIEKNKWKMNENKSLFKKILFMLWKNRYILLFWLLFLRVIFLFMDKFIQEEPELFLPSDLNTGVVITWNIQEIDDVVVFSGGDESDENSDLQYIDDTEPLSVDWFMDVDSSATIQSLQSIYESSKDPKIFSLLIQKLVQQYEFNNAWYYLKNIDIYEEKVIDISLYTYIRFNVLSVLDQEELDWFVFMITKLADESLLSKDELNFYLLLVDIWKGNYSYIQTSGTLLSSPKYLSILEEINVKLASLSQQQDIPEYYRDSLIGFVFMKNGYFSIAKKLALNSILIDDSYILPYQILAYTHFLTKNWNIATEYFLKLVDLDSPQQSIYKFFVGISNYWVDKNKTSILYLSQVKNLSFFRTDVYRYLILNYENLEDYANLQSSWDFVLEQEDLLSADLYHLYYYTFFDPYRSNKAFDFYLANEALIDKSFTLCDDLWDEDVCLYGKVGLDIAQENRDLAENKLLYLAKEFPQSYIFKALWDFYLDQNNTEQAKYYYLKAIGLSELVEEKNVIKNILLKEF